MLYLKRLIPHKHAQNLILTLLFIFGIVIRLLLPFREGYMAPFRSGGLFLEFAQQILNHGYSLPTRIPYYTNGGIPFAYPPLPFYFEAFLIDKTQLSEFIIGNLLPPLISIITLFTFYLLVKELNLDQRTKQASLLAYALMPVTFFEEIESSGLAEAFGSLALICFAIALEKTRKNNTPRLILFSGVMWAFCVVSSPGSIYASILMFFIFAWVMVAGSSRATIVKIVASLFACGACALAFSSPYWLTVVLNHGIELFINSFSSQHGNLILQTVEKIAYFKVSGGHVYFLWDVMVFCGILWAISKRKYALVAWFFTTFCIPREGNWLAALPASILAGIGIEQVFHRLVSKERFGQYWRGAFWFIFYMYVFLYPFWMIKNAGNLYQKGYWSEAITGMQWCEQNLPQNSTIIALTDAQIREWVPHVAKQTVLNVQQGAEWEPETYRNITALNIELDACHEYKCLEAIISKQVNPENIYLLIDTQRYNHYESIHCDDQVFFRSLVKNDSIVIGQIITID